MTGRRRTRALDVIAAQQAADGHLPYTRLGQWERTHAVHILTDRGFTTARIADRFRIDARLIQKQRAKPRIAPTAPDRAFAPPENLMPTCDCRPPAPPARSHDEIASTAQNLCDDLAEYPDLHRVLADTEMIAANEPRFAAQIMMALAAWVPLDDTVADRESRQRQLVIHRHAAASERMAQTA